jgi:hypothetical protein
MHNKDYHNKKGYEHKQSSAYNCIAYDNRIPQHFYGGDKEKPSNVNTDNDLFVGCTTEKYMVIYKNKCKELVAEFPIVDCHVTSLLLCPLQGLLLAGTSKGTLRVYSWPMTENSFELTLGQNNKVKLKEPSFL